MVKEETNFPEYHDDCNCVACTQVRAIAYIGTQLKSIANILNNAAIKGKL
jgi:hypothetical protein